MTALAMAGVEPMVAASPMPLTPSGVRGECEVIGDKLGGIAVHIGARVAAMATPDEVLASSTVKDLVAGSGLRFEDRGTHALKGVPGEWRLFAVDHSPERDSTASFNQRRQPA